MTLNSPVELSIIGRLAVVAGLAVGLAGAPVPAVAATGIPALDQPAIPVKAPSQVTMIALARAGNRLVGVGVHGAIIYSDDNGVTWKQASVPVGVLLTCVAFATPRRGWAAGHYGVVLRTSDGGATWQEQLDGDHVNQLILANANATLAAKPTSDTAQRAVHRAGFFVADGPDKPFLTILASDSNNVTVFGAYRMAVKSADGGKTWSDWSLNIGDPLSHNLYDVARVGGDIFIAGEAGHDFVSTDGGATFAQLASPSLDDSTMFGVVATGDGGVLMFGVAGDAYTSHDAGKTWRAVSMGTAQNLTAARTLSSGAILVAAEDGNLYISRDHAAKFTPLPQPMPMALFDLVQAPNGAVIAGGSGGIMTVPAADLSQDQDVK
jgi:photosystem II stability/assembly factor-like uncharacterized protein